MFVVNAFGKHRQPSSEPVPLTSIEFEILLSLAAGDSHGYAIKLEIEARSDGDLVMRPGTLYRAISRLLDAGLIGELDEAPDPEQNDERRRYYTLTAQGHTAATIEARRLARQVHAARARKLLPRQACGESSRARSRQ
jgi:DNA-binding PadR family transcriptional regulator